MVLSNKSNIIGVIFFVLLNMFIFNTLDDPLNPEIEPFLNLSNPVAVNDAHAVLYAMNAPLKADVIKFGHNLIEDYQLNNDPSIFDFENKIDLSDKQTCRTNSAQCIEQFKNGSRQYKTLTEVDIELQRRTQLIKQLNPTGHILTPNIETPQPYYRAIFYAQDKKYQELINTFLSGDKKTPLAYLYNDTEYLIKSNKFQPTLIASMTTIAAINNNLDLIAALSKDNEYVRTIRDLNFSDIDLKKPFSHEFRTLSNFMHDFIDGKVEGSYLSKEATIIDISVRHALLKRNSTINTLFDAMQTLYWHEGDSFSEFIDMASSRPDIKFDNIIGDLLGKIESSAYLKYSFKSVELACKISNYNQTIDPLYQADTFLNKEQCAIVKQKLSEVI